MATQITSDLLANGGGLTLNETPSSTKLGCRAVSNDGREYRYALAGGTALVVGKLQQSAAEITNHQDLTPTAAAAIAATSITVTLGNTAATANYYAGGFALITTSTGVGYMYRIASNPAANASATIVLTLDDAITIATATSSRVDLYPSPYQSVIVNPTTASSAPVGVAISAITNAQYGWIQTKGISNVLMDGTGVVGTAQVASNAVAGAVEPLTGVQAAVGTLLTGVADQQYGAILLNLA